MKYELYYISILLYINITILCKKCGTKLVYINFNDLFIMIMISLNIQWLLQGKLFLKITFSKQPTETMYDTLYRVYMSCIKRKGGLWKFKNLLWGTFQLSITMKVFNDFAPIPLKIKCYSILQKRLSRILDISNCDVIYYVIYVICSNYVGKAISPLFAWPSSYTVVNNWKSNDFTDQWWCSG